MAFCGGRIFPLTQKLTHLMPLQSQSLDHWTCWRCQTTFSDLGTTQSVKCCNLSVKTFETLGKIHANLHYLHDKKATEANKSTSYLHGHMHTREETDIDLEVAHDLEENFAWVLPLSAEPAHSDDSLAGPESI